MRMLSYKKDEKDKFEMLCREIFKFLEDGFGFIIIKIERTAFGTYIFYKNNTVAVQISFVPRDGGIFVDLIRLTEGKIIEIEDTVKKKYDLLDLLTLQNLAFKIYDPALEELINNESVVKKVLLNRAVVLKKYGEDILKGNFSILSEIKKIQNKREKLQK